MVSTEYLDRRNDGLIYLKKQTRVAEPSHPDVASRRGKSAKMAEHRSKAGEDKRRNGSMNLEEKMQQIRVSSKPKSQKTSYKSCVIANNSHEQK